MKGTEKIRKMSRTPALPVAATVLVVVVAVKLTCKLKAAAFGVSPFQSTWVSKYVLRPSSTQMLRLIFNSSNVHDTLTAVLVHI